MVFTLSAYKQLIYSLQSQGYSFQTLQDFIQEPKDKTVILRHDVDRKPENALVIAKIEKEAGIKASYYFRIVKESYDENIIEKIAKMGHEIGYHYENLSEMSRKAEVRGQRSEVRRARARDRDPQITQTRLPLRGTSGQVDVDYLIGRRHTRTDADIYPADPPASPEPARHSPEAKPMADGRERWRAGFAGQKESSLREKKDFRDKFFEFAIDDFRLNLEKLRKLYPVKTICMHGSPLSKWDNRDLWKRYNYRDFGIIAEPYFDLDFDEVLYLTDTGRRWDGGAFNIRDKVKGTEAGGRGSEVRSQKSEDRGQRTEVGGQEKTENRMNFLREWMNP